MDLLRLLGMEASYSRAKLGVVLGATALYVTLALVRGPDAASTLMLVTVPVVLAAWSFGVRAAILASAVGFLMNGVIAMAVAGEDLRTWLSVSGLLGTSILLIVGVTVGRLCDLGARLRRELAAREAMQGALWRADERLQAALGSMVDAVLTIDRRGQVTYLNPAAERLFGYDRSEVLGKNVSMLMPAPYHGEHDDYIANYQRTGVPKIIGIGREVRGRRKDGSVFEMELSVGELPDDEGSGFIGVARDLTARNRQRDSEHLLAEIATNMAEGVYLIRTSDGVIVYANEVFESMFGYDAGELNGKHVSVVNAPGEKSPEETALEIMEALKATGSWQGEIRNVKKDGTPFWCHASVSTFEHHEHGAVWVSVHQDITEQKEAREALRDSEERFRALFRSAPVGIAVSDAKGRLAEVNGALEEMLQRTASEMRGHHISEFWPGVQRLGIGRRMRSGEVDAEDELREIKRSAGGSSWARVSAAVVRTQDGDLDYIIRVVQDVTEQKRAEEALRQSEERYRALFDSAPVGIAIAEAGGIIVQTNPALEKMLGRTAEELRGSKLRDFRLGGRSSREAHGFSRLESGEIETLRFDQPLVHSSGETVWARVTATAVPSQTGQVEHVFRMVEDVTEERQAEEALWESAERYRLLFESAPVGIAITEPRGVMVQINPALERMLGRTEEELCGSRLRDFRPDSSLAPSNHISRHLASGETETLRYERQFVHSNGAIVWTHITATAVPALTGQPTRVVRVIEDITERKEAERALQDAEAEGLDRTRHLASIGQLAAGVAHEINNPLNSVMGFPQLVLGEESLSAQARSDLETVYSESQRASKIVQNLLSFARKREPERRPVDVRSVVERACHLKEYDLRKHDIELRTHFPQGLPLILGDERQLTEVMLNLLTNAEQAIASAERPGVVTVTCGESGGLVQITVANDGPGIPPEILGRIFEPFFTTKEVGEGTGLGLSMCQGIVREHEGELWAESTLGADTTFFITLPVPHPTLTLSMTPATAREHEAVPGMRILVVDDEPRARDLMARALAKDNHTVEQASDGDDAWRQIQSTPYDCVIADLRMPGSSGQELYRLVEASDPDLAARFIFITGDTMSPDTNTFLSSVAADSLMKPIDIAELRRRVAELHERGETADEPEQEPPIAEGAGTQGPEQEEGAS